MRVLLKTPTEKACKDFEKQVLASDPFYSSDCDDDNEDVAYTFSGISQTSVQQWGEKTVEQGVVASVIVLDSED